MRRTARRGCPILVSAALVLAAAACQDHAAGEPQDAGVDSQVAPSDASAQAARSGRDGRPEGVPYDFCADALMKLPIDGAGGDTTFGIGISGSRVLHTRRPWPPNPMYAEVQLMDLEACREYPLTNGAEAGWLSTSESSVLFVDTRGGAPNLPIMNIFRVNLDTRVEDQITDNDFPEPNVRGTDHHALFLRAEEHRITAPQALILRDLDSGEERELAPGWATAGYFDLDDDHAAFAAYTDDPQSVGRDVFVHDIARNETEHLDSTYAGVQEWVTVRGDYLADTVMDTGMSYYSRMILHRLASGSETVVVDEDGAVGRPVIEGSLLAYNCNHYQTERVLDPSDIELMDLETGEHRRVTTRPSALRAIGLSFPYLLLIDVLEQQTLVDDYYVAHLVRLGIADEAGHLLPGDGVVEPPR